ncbi:MAG: DUF6531 domain-containing protein [Nannocystaceae bacterium]
MPSEPTRDLGEQVTSDFNDLIATTKLAETINKLRDPDISLGDVLQLSPLDALSSFVDDIATSGLAAIANGIGSPSLPAVEMGSFFLGLLHAHAFKPFPVLAVGTLAFVTCPTVFIRGLPCGRAGDLGFVLCAPNIYFSVTTGSAKVFFGGGRAARMGDFCVHGGFAPKGGASAIEPGSAECAAWKAINIGRKSLGKVLNANSARDSARDHQRAKALQARILRVRAQAQTDAAQAGEEGDLVVAADLEFAAAQAEAEAEGAAAEQEATGTRMGAIIAGEVAATVHRTAAAALEKLDPAAPPSVGTMIPLGLSVYVGGIPVPELTLSKWLGKTSGTKWGDRVVRRVRDGRAGMKLKLRGAGSRAKARMREAVPRRLRMLAGHPVDVVTGAVLTEGVDATLRGGWDLALRRHYASSWALRSGPLGPGWSLSLDVAVWIEEGARLLVHRTPDGREVMLELPAAVDLRDGDDERALAELIVVDPQHGLRVARVAGGWRITVGDGEAYSSDGIRAIDLVTIAADHEAEGRRAFARARRLHGPRGAVIELEHDTCGRLLGARQGPRRLGVRWRSIACPGGAEPRVVALTLSAPEGPGEVTHARYIYDARGDLVAVVDALDHRLALAYDDEHRLLCETLADGRAFTFAYDGPGPLARCARTAGPDGVYARSFTYDPQRRRTVVEAGDGAVTIVQADGYDRVCAVTDSLGREWTYAHDAEGRRVAEVDPLGGETRYAYDGLGCRAHVRRADGSTWSFDHDEEGRRVAAIDGAGGRWRWAYDAQGRRIEAVDPCGAATRWVYGAQERVVELLVADERGDAALAARLELGPAGEVLLHERPGGAATSYRYDRRGRCVAIVDGDGARRTFRYDRADRLIEVIEADGASRSIRRDALGRPASVDGDGVSLRLEYAPCGGLAALLDARDPSASRRYTYDCEGRLLAAESGDGLRHELDRDVLGAVIAEVDADGRKRRVRRDACGRVEERVDGDGARTTYAYELCGRLAAIDYADGARERFTYTADGSLERATREEPRAAPGIAFDDASAPLLTHIAEFMRDACGRIVGEGQRGDLGPERGLTRGLDARGRPRTQRVELCDGRIAATRFGYERSDTPEVSSIRLRAGASEGTILIARDACDREVSRRLPGGALARTRRDRRGRPLAQELSAGRDPFDRVLGAPQSAAIGRTYSWEPAENMSNETCREDGAGRERDTDAAGRLRTLAAAGGDVRLRWDAAGRLRALERRGEAIASFDYDALGRRVRAVTSLGTTTWAWSGDLPIAEENEVGGRRGSQLWVFAPAPAGAAERFSPVAGVLGGDIAAIVCDLVGAPIAATDAHGERVEVATPFAAAGERVDAETGLRYVRHRYLDPASGRFLSPDPSGLRGGLDPTAHVRDPARRIDPLGLRGVDALAPWPADAVGSVESGPIDPEPDPPAPQAPDITPPQLPTIDLPEVAPAPTQKAVDAAYTAVRPLSRECGS